MNLLNITTLLLLGNILYTGAASEVPGFLSECYKVNWAVSDQYQQLPMTMPVLIDIIRSLEDQPGITHNIEDIASILFYHYRLDGVKKNPDYSFHSYDYQYDRQKLIKRMLQGQTNNRLNISLPLEEKCHLHFMLSNAVDNMVRGDEHVTCSGLNGHPNESDEDTSQCPVESGVILTEFGPITAGTVITGIVAGLQSMEKKVTSNNLFSHVHIVWAATLAGQLATIPFFHMSSSVINVSGTFDDPFFPRYYYINDNRNWYLTEAGINGGIDGLILATNVAKWRKRFKRIKLSQLLEMYYSRRGVFNRKIYAGKRFQLINEILKSYQNPGSPLEDVLHIQVYLTSLDLESQSNGKMHLNKKPINDLSLQAAKSFLDLIKEFK